GILTGKGMSFGGSLIRPEATGYGLIYFLEQMLEKNNDTLEGKTVAVSGYGNVGTFAIEKVNELGGKVVTIADEHGYVYDPDGISGEKLDYLKDLWVVHRKSAKDFADKYKLQWVPGKRPWYVPCDIALPTATQNELNEEHAKELVKNGVKYVAEGANMPSSNEAIQVFLNAGVHFAPGKAANAGGVATSGLEMCQNSMRYNWTREEVDAKLKAIMADIHDNCVKYGTEDGKTSYVQGANIAGFVKVADAMLAQGIV
ncbi:MAG: NADP-specific glutamate dehydrogenase, partial [Clostridiales bacterium]